MNLRGRIVTGVLVAMVVVLSACGGGGSDESTGAGQGTSEETAAAGGSATITAFDVPASAPCGGKTFTTVSVKYEMSGAARGELRVDGRAIPLKDPKSGTVDADVRCDPLPHDLVLVAFDADEAYTTKSAIMNTVG